MQKIFRPKDQNFDTFDIFFSVLFRTLSKVTSAVFVSIFEDESRVEMDRMFLTTNSGGNFCRSPSSQNLDEDRRLSSHWTCASCSCGGCFLLPPLPQLYSLYISNLGEKKRSILNSYKHKFLLPFSNNVRSQSRDCYCSCCKWGDADGCEIQHMASAVDDCEQCTKVLCATQYSKVCPAQRAKGYPRLGSNNAVCGMLLLDQLLLFFNLYPLVKFQLAPLSLHP